MQSKNAFFIIAIISVFILSGCTAKSDNLVEDSISNDLEPSTELLEEDNSTPVQMYLTDNISKYAPEEPVLGGSWYVTDIQFIEDKALVFYEDGHIARKVFVDFEIGTNTIDVVSAIKTYSDELDDINISAGDKFVIALESNPTTGFKWNTGDLSGVVVLRTEGFIPSSGELIGSGGTEYFIYEAIDIGEDEINLMYARPWESVQPLERKIFNVVVE